MRKDNNLASNNSRMEVQKYKSVQKDLSMYLYIKKLYSNDMIIITFQIILKSKFENSTHQSYYLKMPDELANNETPKGQPER